jgi:hypothetical protein
MIQAIPGKARYQVFMEHALPGHFAFVTSFADAEEAERHAAHLHAERRYGDVVVLDAKEGTLLEALPGRLTLSGRNV